MKTIIIADDHAVFREGFKLIHSLNFPEDTVLEAENGQVVLDLVKQQPVNLVVLDLQMPEKDGIAVAEELVPAFPGVRVLVLSYYAEPALIRKLLGIGIHGYLSKNAPQDEIEKAVKCLRSGMNFYGQQVAEIMHQTLMKEYQLTHTLRINERFNDRELSILQYICEEKTNRQIADMLHISERTVEGYRKSLMEKTGANNVIGLVKFAIKHQIYEL